jgi:hypothetical protein
VAIRNRIPTVSGWAQFAEGGNLMSYGPNLRDCMTRLAYFADRIVKGTRPAVIPVELPTRVEFVLNQKAAKALGITIPRASSCAPTASSLERPMSRYHLAQLNVGIATAPLDSAVMADFMNNLDRINALAESAPGSCGGSPATTTMRRRCGRSTIARWSTCRCGPTHNRCPRSCFAPPTSSSCGAGANGSSACPRPISSCGGCRRATSPRRTRR